MAVLMVLIATFRLELVNIDTLDSVSSIFSVIKKLLQNKAFPLKQYIYA